MHVAAFHARQQFGVCHGGLGVLQRKRWGCWPFDVACYIVLSKQKHLQEKPPAPPRGGGGGGWQLRIPDDVCIAEAVLNLLSAVLAGISGGPRQQAAGQGLASGPCSSSPGGCRSTEGVGAAKEGCCQDG